MNPQIEQAREMIKQSMIATLMREQGLGQLQAEAYADQQLAMSQPPGSMDTLSAQEGYGGPPQPDIGADPGYRAGVGPGGEMLGDLAPGEPDPTMMAGAPEAGAGTGASEGAPSAGFYDVMGADGMEQLLGMRALDSQISHAESLRDKEGPQGMHTRATYVAANPLSHLASGVEKYRAKKDVKRLRGEEKDSLREISRILRGEMKAEEEDVGFGSGVGRVA